MTNYSSARQFAHSLTDIAFAFVFKLENLYAAKECIL